MGIKTEESNSIGETGGVNSKEEALWKQNSNH
jgi:hypothetical protein